MTQEQREARAREHEAMAATNEAYMRAMERTTERSGGMLGHLAAPHTYAAHQLSAARHHRLAADLRTGSE